MTDLDTHAARPAAGRGRAVGAAAALRRAAPALAGYAAVRLLGLAGLALWAAARGTDPLVRLTARWDSLWYARIAESGYGYTVRLPNGDVHADLAFFPLLPWLERGVAAVSPLSYAHAGLLVSVVASLAAAWGIFAVTDLMLGRRAGVCAAVLWAALPVGIVQSMAYSESLFTALAAWSLYAVLTGRWPLAGGLALLAGLTRPVGLAVAAAVWAGAVASFVRQRSASAADGARNGPRDPHAAHAGIVRSPRGASPWPRALGMLLAPLGAAGYVLWVGHRTGQGPFGYLDVQAGWRNGFDGGVAFARFVAGLFVSVPGALAGTALIAGVLLVGWLLLAGVRARLPLPLLLYGGLVALLALCASSYFGSKPRLLVPAFPLLLPVAAAAARARPVLAHTFLGLAAAVSAVYGGLWLTGSGPP
ncbi:hypothetical protein [Streptomyces abyssomicinicus]|uniref:hypothetical protein n=1 Tax=Streptomyces abyssomicinicus TaxID=574929 RepID=UPI003F767A37